MGSNLSGDNLTIAYIAQTFPALTQTFVYREVSELRAIGFKVITCAIWKPNVGQLSGESKQYVGETNYIFPIEWGKFFLAHIQIILRYPLRYFSTFLFILSRRGESFRNRLRTFYHFLEAVSLAPVLIDGGVDHIHAHFSINAATVAFVLSRLLNISFSFTAHNIFFSDRLLLEDKVTSAKFIVSISDYSKQFLLKLIPMDGIANKIHIVHCGLSPEEFAPADNIVQNEVPEILFVAQLEVRKGAPFLIEACRLLSLKGFNFQCNLIGDGPQRIQLQELISAYGITDKVKLLGALPQEDVRSYLDSADIFILPCITAENGDMDGIPVSLMEAMAMEIPVISTRVSGIPELIDDGESGILVDQKDTAALSEAISRLVCDPGLRKQIAFQGRQKIIEEFNLHQTSIEIGNLFQHYLTKHREQ